MELAKQNMLDLCGNNQTIDTSKYINLPISKDIFTELNLKELSNLSEMIVEPKVMGIFEDEKHYLDTLELVLNSTNETSNRLAFFKNIITPSVSKKEHVLDVGPGDYALTKIVIPEFKNLTVVDENEYILNNSGLALPGHIKINKILGGIESVNLKKELYDLVVMSHILYYVDSKNWMNVVKNAYHSLQSNGMLVIVLGGDELQKADLIKHFGGETLQINTLAKQCYDIFGFSNVSLFSSEEVFFANTLKSMLHISAFMLKDAKITAKKDDLIQYIENNLKVGKSDYRMTTRQKYIVIKKGQFIRSDMDMINGVETTAV